LGSDGLIFDPSRKLLFVPAGKSGTLTVIGLGADKAPEVLQTVKTASGARLGALEPRRVAFIYLRETRTPCAT